MIRQKYYKNLISRGRLGSCAKLKLTANVKLTLNEIVGKGRGESGRRGEVEGKRFKGRRSGGLIAMITNFREKMKRMLNGG